MLNAARKVVHAPNVAAHASDASHDTTAVFFCYDCGRTFPSMMLLNNHAHRSHGYVSPVRSYIIDLQCKACLTTFGTRERLVQHLRNFTTNDCLSVLAGVYQPIPSPMVAALDADALFLTKSASAVAPAFRSQGPRIGPPLAGSGLRVLYN